MRTALILAAGIALMAPTLASAQTPATQVPAAGQTTMTDHFIKLNQDAKLASIVDGLDVYNGNKDNIGKVKDVAYDDAGVKAYILSVGGFLGMGTRYVAVTPAQIKVNYDPGDKMWHATMNATKDELKAAPEFKYDGVWNASKS
jgi:hypothetical protein